jgi:hypothetical protein
MSKKNRPSLVRSPDSKKIPHTSKEIDNLENRLFRWRINSNFIDLDHEEWGWVTKLDIDGFFNLLEKHLHRYESTDWKELKKQNNCHPLPVEKIVPRAQERLCDKCPGVDSLYQVSAGEVPRVWGVRREDILYLIWYDPDHTVYPIKR